MDGDGVPGLAQHTDPRQVGPGLRQELIDCWVTVSNAGGAVGFPFLPVDPALVAAATDELIAGLDPRRGRLLVAWSGPVLAGWAHLGRSLNPLVAHWGTVSRLQTHPDFRGQGFGRGLMGYARRLARDEMGLEQLRLALRGGTGLERFYAGLGWEVTGRWPAALRIAPGDDRDEVLMTLAPL